MKLKRFNESTIIDSNKEIIRDAFYNITDKYPLHVTFSDIESLYNGNKYIINISYKNEYYSTYNEDNLNDIIKQDNFVLDLHNMILISLRYLKNDFKFSSLNIYQQSISIILYVKEFDNSKIYDVSKSDKIWNGILTINKSVLQSNFKSLGVNIKSIDIESPKTVSKTTTRDDERFKINIYIDKTLNRDGIMKITEYLSKSDEDSIFHGIKPVLKSDIDNGFRYSTSSTGFYDSIIIFLDGYITMVKYN